MKEDKNFTIHISSATVIKVILILVLVFCLYLIKDLVLVVLAAIVLASSIEPATKWFGNHRVSRLPAVILIYGLLALTLAAVFFFFVPRVLSEAAVYVEKLPESVSFGDLWNPTQDEIPVVATETMSLKAVPAEFPAKTVVDDLQSIISGTGEGVFKTASTVFGGALSFVLIVVISFYLSVQEDGVRDFLKIITPVKSQKYITDLWRRSQLKIGYWMQGQLLLGVLIGVLVYLGLVVLGVKHALLLAVLAACFELIPVFGPILAAIPAVVIASVDGGVTAGLLVTGLYLIIQQFENHLIYPVVVKKIVGISPIVVILALFIGAKLAGFLGALLAVPLSAALMEFVSDVQKDKMKELESEVA